MVKVKIKKLNPEAIVPDISYKGDAGMDLYSVEEYTLKPGERHLFSTGISASVPEGYVSLVWDRSGNAAKRGLKTMAGVIDCHYRGEWKIVLLNTTNEEYTVKKGDKIAQVLVQPVARPEVEEVEELDEDTERGEGGFGSSGR